MTRLFFNKLKHTYKTDFYIWTILAIVITSIVFYTKEDKFPLQDIAIALIALYIALRTFSSIDQVDKLGKMDGNVLDNERYITSIVELTNEFKESDNIQLANNLFKSIENRLRSDSKTASDFADTLQHMIDLIVLFPAVFNSKENNNSINYDARMEFILELVKERHERFLLSVNKGSLIQISEAIKLFKAVNNYQKKVSKKDFNVNSDLLLVRGAMLKNPVTRTIYHNYLGLVFHKKALNLINIKEKDTLSINAIKEIVNGDFDASTKENIVVYLNYANEQFNKAILASKEDIMWSGFINFNKARSLFLISLLSKNNNWLEILDMSINARNQLNFFIGEALNLNNGSEKTETYLYKFFKYQEEYARIVKLNFLTGTDVFDKSYTYRGIKFNELNKKDKKSLFEKNTTVDFGNITKYKQFLINAN